MIWIALGAVVGLVGGYRLERDWMFAMPFAIGGAALGGGVGILAGAILGHSMAVTDRPLAALETHQGISGRFFLGSGSVDSKPVWAYYVTDDSGLTRLETIATDRAAVRQTATTAPSAHCWTNLPDVWTLPTGSQQCVFNIPPGSIANNYSIPTKGDA